MLILLVVEIIQWLGVHHFRFMTALDSFTASKFFLLYSWTLSLIGTGPWELGNVHLSPALRLLLVFLEPILKFHNFLPVLYSTSIPVLSGWPSLGHAKCSESARWLNISSSTKQSPQMTEVLNSLPPVSYVCLPAPISEEGAHPFYKIYSSIWALNLIFFG